MNKIKRIALSFGVFSVLVFLFFAVSCKTAQFHFVSEIQEIDIKELEGLELDILRLRFESGAVQAKDLYASIEKKIERNKNKHSLNENFNAWLYGIEGEFYSLNNQTEKIKEALAKIRQSGGSTVWSAILSSYLESDSAKKTAALLKAPQTGLVQLKLALAYFDADEYAKAVASFDNALTKLDEAYLRYYKPKRDMAYQFVYNPPQDTAAKQLFGEKALSLEQVISTAKDQPGFLNRLGLKSSSDLPDIYLALQQKGFISPSAELFLPFTRAETARFLAYLFTFAANPGTMFTSAEAYKKRGRSPIPDVALTDGYFPFIVFVIEKEIMELPDGRNFFPSEAISGMDYNKSMEKIRLLR